MHASVLLAKSGRSRQATVAKTIVGLLRRRTICPW